MVKTTIIGWSLETPSDFVQRLNPPKHRMVPAQRTTLKASLSQALGYKKDPNEVVHEKMVKWIGKEDMWFKYRERDFR